MFLLLVATLTSSAAAQPTIAATRPTAMPSLVLRTCPPIERPTPCRADLLRSGRRRSALGMTLTLVSPILAVAGVAMVTQRNDGLGFGHATGVAFLVSAAAVLVTGLVLWAEGAQRIAEATLAAPP